MGLAFTAREIQDKSEYSSYLALLENPKYILLSASSEGENVSMNSLMRVNNVFFAVKEVTKGFANFFLGHGPGSISYNSYTLAYSNDLARKRQGSSNPLMTYIYELGVWGPLILVVIFYRLVKVRRKAIRPEFGLAQYYYDNSYVLFAIYFLGTIYTAVFNNYILLMYFAIQISFLNHLSLSQK